jgi:hypothetical protein
VLRVLAQADVVAARLSKEKPAATASAR